MITYTAEVDALRALARKVSAFDKAIKVNPVAGPAVREGMIFMAYHAERHASQITHRDTWTLYRSYVTDFVQIGDKAQSVVYVDPTIINPNNERPAIYALVEFGRGGDHDAFGLTVQAADTYVFSGIGLMMDVAMQTANQTM